MKITYRYYSDWTLTQKSLLSKYEVGIETGYGKIDVVDDGKNDKLLELLNGFGIKPFYWTDYERKDYQKKSLFAYGGSWSNGYPMPDTNGKYLDDTYNLENYCDLCGGGKVQESPFQIKKAVKWGSRMMFELNWVYDEIFVRKELFDKIFAPLGIQAWPVQLYGKKTEVSDTVQLKIPTTNSPLMLSKQEFEICMKCSRKRYSTQIRGYFPGFERDAIGGEIVKSMELFGTGKLSYNKIFITTALWEALKLLKVKVNLFPIENRK